MIIYNLFPRLLSNVSSWVDHYDRIADMNFDWIYVNPIQETGGSRSLYSIKNYFGINHDFVDHSVSFNPEEQIVRSISLARTTGLKTMVDLVINHSASDSSLIKEHPDWYRWENGSVLHPSCVEDGHTVVWGDLAKFNHDNPNFLNYCKHIIDYLLSMGFLGFRCDAAYQIPQHFWEQLIRYAKSKEPTCVFLAETLGCSMAETWNCINAGFDYIFNSSKWWTYEGDWLLNTYNQTRNNTKSVSFPESHDTSRLFDECHGNINYLKQRYFFAAMFSAGVMTPIGYEFGFKKKPHVCHTTHYDWENTNVNITCYISQVNALKRNTDVLLEDSETYIWDHHNNSNIKMMLKKKGSRQVLILINKDCQNSQHFSTESLYNHISGSEKDYIRGKLSDATPDDLRGDISNINGYECTLTPGQGRVIVNF